MKHFIGKDEQGNWQYEDIPLFSDKWKEIVLNQYSGYKEVIKAVNYGTACPAQWELTLKDGTCLYVRFRHGYMSISAGKTHEEAVMGEEIFGYFQDQMGGGEMDFDELKNICCMKLVFSCEEEFLNKK